MISEETFTQLPRPSQELTLTTVFIDKNYLDVFKNWHKFSSRFIGPNLLVVSLDVETHQIIEQLGITSQQISWDGNLNSLWIARVAIFKQLLSAGYNLIHSDADAVWLKNPIPYCRSLTADMAFSQGTVWPPKVHRNNGVVLCCGYFYLRSNSKTIAFTGSWMGSVIENEDDQRALNELLLSMGMKWPMVEDYHLRWQEKKFRCFNEVQYCKLSNEMKITLLPHRLFQRIAEDKDAIVRHPLSMKDGFSTEQTLKQYNCWDYS
ncbi:MAG: putative nucleotide-diphospho-sugar transferase [Oceanicoccus sp.]